MTTVKELKAICKKLGIKKYSTMKKTELEQAIKKHTKRESQKDLKKKQKEKTMYQKVKDSLVGPELSQQNEQENESKHAKEFRKKVNKALTSKKISSANLNKIEKFYQDEPNLQTYCNDKSKYMSYKNFIRVNIELYMNYYVWNRPENIFSFTKKMSHSVDSYRYNNPSYTIFMDKDGQKDFLPHKKTLSLENLMDVEWFAKQNEYLNALSSFQISILFAYTYNSYVTITPFIWHLILKKSKDNLKKIADNYRDWIVIFSSRVDTIFLGFLVIFANKKLFHLHFNDKQREKIEKIIPEDMTDITSYSDVRRFIKKECTDEQILSCAKIYIGELYKILNFAPSVSKPFYLFRVETNPERFKNNRTLENQSFTSTSNDQSYIRSRNASYLIRFLIEPGSKVLFVRGCSYYEKENEFIIAPSLFHDIHKITLYLGETVGTVCGNIKTNSFDVKVKPLPSSKVLAEQFI